MPLTKPERVREHLADLVTRAIDDECKSPDRRVAIRTVGHCGGSVFVELANGDVYHVVASLASRGAR